MAFEDDLTRHAEQIRARIPNVKGEEATKHALVLPLLQVLGYDVFDPREVQPEYVADFASKSRGGQREKIDYSIQLNGAASMFVECKSVDEALEDHTGQLARYFNATPSVRVAVLTNGAKLKVFTDLQQPNVMDPVPWVEVDLLSLKPAHVEALRRLCKADFASEAIVTFAESMTYQNSFAEFIARELRDPSESFVKYVAGEVFPNAYRTKALVDRLKPVLQKAIQMAISDTVAKSFAQESTPPPQSPPPPEVRLEPAPTDEGHADSIVTTAEELECFDLVSKWIHEVRPDTPIASRDSKS